MKKTIRILAFFILLLSVLMSFSITSWANDKEVETLTNVKLLVMEKYPVRKRISSY